MAHTLDTDSLINAFRRFMGRRGAPSSIRDNGTEFVGGEREMPGVIEDWNTNQINDFVLQSHVRWIFNPSDRLSHGWSVGAAHLFHPSCSQISYIGVFAERRIICNSSRRGRRHSQRSLVDLS